MSARANQIALDAANDVGTQYYWASFMNAGAMYDWATGGLALNLVGQSEDHAICCFEYPMLLAARRGYLSADDARKIIGALMDSGFNAESFETTWTKVWNDWPDFPFSGTYWRPRRGDLVFYRSNTGIGGDTNHVVLSLGPDNADNIEVISFGEGLQNPAQAAVTRSTVNGLRQQGHSAVKYVAPPWY
jgi:hypothetical protein